MEKPTKISGRIWVIRDKNGEAIDSIDTDMIYHNAHLHITDIEKMGQYAFGNLEGWKDFPKKITPGDIVIVGKNFGAGSSRQQAVDCFASLGVSLIIAESIGAIYKRNAINSGFPILTCENIMEQNLQNGDEITVDLTTGEIEKNGDKITTGEPFPKVQMDIYQAGNLFAYGKEIG